MNKKEWKVFYRKLMVAHRERLKASIELAAFGSACIFVPNDGSDIKNILISEVYLKDFEI